MYKPSSYLGGKLLFINHIYVFEKGASFRIINITFFSFTIMQPSNNYRMQMSLDFIKSSQKIERFAIVKIHLYKGAYLQIQIYDVAC